MGVAGCSGGQGGGGEIGRRQRLVAEQFKRIYRHAGRWKKKEKKKGRVQKKVENWLFFGSNWSGKV